MSETRKECKFNCGHEACRAWCVHAPSATPPTPESDAHREVRKSVVCEKCYGLTSCWCPPTPDLAAVREALVRVLEDAVPSLMTDLCEAVGVDFLDADCSPRVADALLAAVSRPAEARGEPVAWLVVEDTDRKMSAHLFSEAANLTAETHRIANASHDYAVQPLYAHPAPSGGEGFTKRVKVDEMFVRELGQESAPVTMRVEQETGGDLQLILTRHDCAAPRPETGEVSAAMVEAFAVMWDGQKALEKHNHERIRASLRAAFAAREGA